MGEEDKNNELNSKKEALDAVSSGDGYSETWTGTKEKRRGFIQKATAMAGVALASIPGVSRVVSARGRQDLHRAVADYEAQADSKAALQAHAGDLIAGLAKRGLLETASVGQLLAESERKVSGLRLDEATTAHIEVKRELGENEELSVFVQPHVGRSYAVHKPDTDDESVTIFESSGSEQDLSTMACTTGGTACYNGQCSEFPDAYPEKETHCCTDGSCYTGGETQCCTGINESCYDVC